MSIVPSGGNALALVQQQDARPVISEEERERRVEEANKLEEKLNFIQDNVATRIFNVSGSSAGAGSGDFHQYRMARRREQSRLARIDKVCPLTVSAPTFACGDRVMTYTVRIVSAYGDMT
jgi:hypothetical protein